MKQNECTLIKRKKENKCLRVSLIGETERHVSLYIYSRVMSRMYLYEMQYTLLLLSPREIGDWCSLVFAFDIPSQNRENICMCFLAVWVFMVGVFCFLDRINGYEMAFFHLQIRFIG